MLTDEQIEPQESSEVSLTKRINNDDDLDNTWWLFCSNKGVTENKIVPLNLGKEYCTVAMVTSTHQNILGNCSINQWQLG